MSKVARANELNRLLTECNFPSICIHAGMKQDKGIAKYKSFKDFNVRIYVSTDLFRNGIDIGCVNVFINDDFPDDSDQFLYCVGRVGSEPDQEVFDKVQSRVEVDISEFLDEIDMNSYTST